MNPAAAKVKSGRFVEADFASEFYDYVVPFTNRRDIEFFVDAAKSVKGEVLEIGCGTGRVLIATARAGVRILGLEPCASMLSICREKISKEPAEVQSRVIGLIAGDMRQFRLNRQFDLITIPFHPFCHLLTLEDQVRCLTTINQQLNDGGKLIFDLYTPALKHLVEEKYSVEFWKEPEFTMPDGRRVVRRSRFLSRNLVTQVIDNEIIFDVVWPDAREEKFSYTFTFRYFWRSEAEDLLKRCGFVIEDVFADYDKSAYGSKYPGELIFVARKKSLP
jgi:SAM-dependent methyltransferase